MSDQPPQERSISLIEKTLLETREKQSTPEEIQELRCLLTTSKQARREFLQCQQLTAALESDDIQALPPRKNILQFPSKYRNHALVALASAGLAACLTAIFYPLLSSPSLPAPPIAQAPSSQPYSLASLSSAYNAVIGGNVVSREENFGEGSLELSQGIAQLAFNNGAQVILEGQCGFEIVDEKTVALHHGKLWVNCPQTAHGFQVLTPDGSRITDLGTEFGVSVGSQGAVKVHVFNGLVEVAGPFSEPRVLRAGHALSWQGANSLMSKGAADPAQFVDSTQLLNKRLATHQTTIRNDPSLILNYNFSDSSRRIAVNHVANAPRGTFGKLVGPTLVQGRGPGHRALQFEHPGDHIDLEIDSLSSYEGATICFWIKLDRFDFHHSALINSDNYDIGAIHFQVTRSGHLKSSINGGPHYTSEDRPVGTGKWHHVAVSWDFDPIEGTLYLDGRALESRNRLEHGPTGLTKEQIHLGPCQIGGWSAKPDLETKDPSRPLAFNRELKGRIDEVLIFSRTFTSSEIDELYQTSKP